MMPIKKQGNPGRKPVGAIINRPKKLEGD